MSSPVSMPPKRSLISRLKYVSAAVQAFYWWTKLIKDPTQLKSVVNMSNALLGAGTPKDFEVYVSIVKADPRGNEAFVNRLRLKPIALDQLRALPPETLGGAYARFVDRHNLNPDTLPSKSDATDVEYLSAHMYETHDIWHVLTGFEPDIAGELGLQGFYMAQFPTATGYFVLAAGFLQTIISRAPQSDERFDSIVLGWTMGRNAKKIFGTNWNELWNRKLDDVRYDLNVLVGSKVVLQKSS